MAVRTAPTHCLSGNLGWLLSQAHYALASELVAAFEPLGVSSRGYKVLAAATDGERTQKELADLVGLDKTTMVVTVDELEAAGLAERRPSKTDRRARVITVTKAGERKVAEGRKVVDRVQADVLAALPGARAQGAARRAGQPRPAVASPARSSATRRCAGGSPAAR